MTIEYKIGDCLELMKELPDKSFDLVLTDPPYGLNIGSSNRLCKERGFKADWDKVKLPREYFYEIRRVSVNQIVFGGNYYDLGPTRGFIIWDKQNDGRDFADCEFAWSSFDEVARIFRYRPINMDGGKVHPCQKPVRLFEWILLNHPECQTILDPFLGSGTTLLACRLTGRDGLGFEINPEYEQIIKERILEAIPTIESWDTTEHPKEMPRPSRMSGLEVAADNRKGGVSCPINPHNPLKQVTEAGCER